MYRPPLVSFMHTTIASAESPARAPLSIIPDGIKWAAARPAPTPQASFAARSDPPFLTTLGTAFKSMVAPMHTSTTPRIGSAPVIRPPVNEPSALPARRKERVDQGTEQQRHHHHPAGDALNPFLDQHGCVRWTERLIAARRLARVVFAVFAAPGGATGLWYSSPNKVLRLHRNELEMPTSAERVNSKACPCVKRRVLMRRLWSLKIA